MATKQGMQCITVPAAADYTLKQFYVMNINSSGQAVLASGAGQQVAGVLQGKPDGAGRAAELAINGVVKAIAGGTFNPGVLLEVTAAGKLDTAVAGAGKFACAIALEAGVDTRIIKVLWLNSFRHVA